MKEFDFVHPDEVGSSESPRRASGPGCPSPWAGSQQGGR